MNYIKGEDRILYFKLNGSWIPVGCLNDNTLDETSEFLDTTTRDNQGWNTSRPINQAYNISFSGLQIITTVAGGNFNVASLDKLRQLKRNKTLLEWKFQGTVYPIVDYGKCYISDLSDANVTGELISFSGSAVGYGRPLTATLGTVLLNNGDPNVIVNSGNENELIRISNI
jgi:hypothetical protein